MADQNRKNDVIRSIESLQLTENLITALDDSQEAEAVAAAVHCLQRLGEQWN